jgi:hypothetical protein
MLPAPLPPLFQARIDVGPKVLEFIGALSPDDIVTELVQNDLDQGARSTRIVFHRDTLVAHGDGSPVDEAGWRRLSYLLGAGGAVEEKRDGIGVKNHGLRSCFALGDEIWVSSAGARTLLALAHPDERGRRRRFNPGAWDHPVPDSEAPAAGARIEVPLRTRPLPKDGKTDTGLAVPSVEELERLFRTAVADAPQRYLGCVRPDVTTRYALVLEHWELGTWTFTYTSGPLRRKGRNRVYRRRCTVTTPDGTTAALREEEAVLFVPREVTKLGRTPRFYRGPAGPVCEISWPVSAKGKPRSEAGRFRYPIAYATDGLDARTEVGVSFSAPFVSNTTRHGLAAGLRTQNEPLVEACEKALVRVLREYLVPTFGVGALAVLHDPSRPGSVRATRLILAAAEAGALPAAQRGKSARGRRGAGGGSPACVPVAKSGRPGFLVPVWHGDPAASASQLAVLAPPRMTQLHGAVPAYVRELLVARSAPAQGKGLPFILFDERDVVARFCGRTSGPHAWRTPDERRRDMADPARAAVYLDVIAKGFRSGALAAPHADEIRKAGLLPDRRGELQPWNALCREREEIPEIPGVELQPSVHPTLVDHAVLTQHVKIPGFQLSEYLARLDFTPATPETRAEFFAWLLKHRRRVRGAAIEALSAQPVWRTGDGAYVTFPQLCGTTPALRRILAGFVHVPASSVRTMSGVRSDGRGFLRLRRQPTGAELRAWWDAASGAFPRDRPLTREEVAAWRRLERDLVHVRADAQLKTEMPWIGYETPAVAGDRWLRRVGELHLGDPAVDACALLPRDRLASGGVSELHRAVGALVRPSAEALVRALSEDPENTEALHPRLAALEAARRANDPPSTDVSALPILVVHGERLAPRQVALRGSPDYWGAWRVPLVLDGAATERQTDLVAVGVAARTPSAETSRAFFLWLSAQAEDVLKAHLDQVIRHLLHKNGPLSWWTAHPSVPCLPVYLHGRKVRLLSYGNANTPSNKVLLPDFAALETAVLARDRRRRIAIVETTATTSSAFDTLLNDWGFDSLRNVAAPPVDVRAASDGREDDALTERLRVVRGEHFGAVFRKRIQEMHLSGSCIRHQWQHQVRGLREVRVATGLEACFRVGKEEYWLPVDSASDVGRSILWISADAGSRTRAFFGALAERVFVPGSPTYLAYALQDAVAAGYEARFDSPARAEPGNASGADELTLEGDVPEEGGRATDVRRTHSLGDADRMPNAPAPAALPTRGGTGVRFAPQRRRLSQPRAESPEERAATDELKEKHYAWHCQVCLASADPSRLAPAGTYAFRPMNRRSMMVGHHVDPVHGEGVRWVSNLLVLCEYHHRQLGDLLSRDGIVAAIATATPHALDFEDDDGARVRIEGLVVVLRLDREPFQLSIFFTREHADAWLGG